MRGRDSPSRDPLEEWSGAVARKPIYRWKSATNVTTMWIFINIQYGNVGVTGVLARIFGGFGSGRRLDVAGSRGVFYLFKVESSWLAPSKGRSFRGA